MKRMKTAKTLSLLMALMLILQLLPLGTALAADAEPADGPEEVVETISGDELGKDVADEETGTEAPTYQAKVRLFSGSDRTEWLTSLLTLEITQGGVPISEGGTIDATQPFAVSGIFSTIPLNGDLGGTFLEQGNYAIFPISANVSLVSEEPSSHTLTDGPITIGTLTFEPTGDGGLQARITFANNLWDEEGNPEYTSINNLQFSASLEHDGTGIVEGETATDITIIGKTFKIHKPAVPIEPTISKTGSLNDTTGIITWTAIVDAEKGGVPGQALEGIKFTDTVGAGHTYVSDSFKVDDDPRTDATVVKSPTTLEYIFTDTDDNGPATITYETQIDDWDTVKYGFTAHNFTNSARVELDGRSDTDSDTVTITQKTYINKTGERVDPSDPLDRQIYWYIEVNQARHSLEDITITDELNDRLVFISAKWQKNTADAGATAVWEDVSTISSEPSDNQYVYSGTTTEHLRLVILTEATIKEGDYTTDEETMYNSASVTWKNKPGAGIGSGDYGVGVGFHALNKTGAFDQSWQQNHLVNWTITVNLKEIGSGSIENFKVYDLLVHGKNNTGVKPDSIDGTIWNALTPRYGQKWVSTGTFTSGLTVTPIQVLDSDGKHVADLIEISGFDTDKAYEVNFTSKMLDPSAFTKNGSVSVTNTATLFDGTTKRKDASYPLSRTVNVLQKSVLAAAADEDSLTGATASGTAGNSFNYVDKTAFFRLSINSSGQNLTDSDFIGGTTITVTDTLPQGWVFDQTYNTKGYKIFEGNAATEVTSDPVTTTSFDTSGFRETVTFTFNTLDKHYVILVKARLTDEAYADLIANNTGSVSQQNDASLVGNGVTVNSNASVSVDTGGLSKTSGLHIAGIADWVIDYNPLEAVPASGHDTVVIKDTLGPGFEPYLDAGFNMDTAPLSGSDPTPRFSIKALELGINGALTETGDNLAPAWIADGRVAYDPAGRELSIELPDGTQPYRIAYLTVLTEAANVQVSNSVAVEGITMNNDSDNGSYTIQNTDASASLGLGGYLRIKKVDSDNTVIADPATFTLSTADGRVIRTGNTNTSGILRFGALSPNTEANPHYWLKETNAPTGGYLADSKEYRIIVTESSGNITTTIYDGGKVVGTFTKDTNTNTTFNVTNWKEEESRPEFGNLMIGKTVVNDKMDKDFTFTIDFGSTPSANGIYTSTDNSGNFTTITIADNKATFTLKGSESITIHELPAGVTYTITEDDYTSDGYITTKTGEAGEIAANTTHTATFINTIPAPHIPNSAKISVLKTDEGGSKLPGAVFTLYNSSGSAIATAISNADGIAEFTNVAPNASYTIRETAAPQGYELSNEVISVTTGDGSTLSFTMVNKKLAEDRGSIVITKTDENGVLLPGASFTLYDADGKAVATAASDATGMIRFADIPVGSYTIRETAAPEGYVLSTEVLSIALEKDATRSFTFINRRDEVPGGSTGSIGLLKVNNNGERLAGAEFSLYDADGSLVARAVTGADGIARFTGLPFGTYSVRETVAPAGYKLFEGAQSVTITAATPDRSFTLRNTAEDDPEVGGWEEIPDGEVPGGPGTPGNKLPQTGGVPQTLFLLLAGLALLGAGLFTLKGQKKQRPAAPGTDE